MSKRLFGGSALDHIRDSIPYWPYQKACAGNLLKKLENVPLNRLEKDVKERMKKFEEKRKSAKSSKSSMHKIAFAASSWSYGFLIDKLNTVIEYKKELEKPEYRNKKKKQELITDYATKLDGKYHLNFLKEYLSEDNKKELIEENEVAHKQLHPSAIERRKHKEMLAPLKKLIKERKSKQVSI